MKIKTTVHQLLFFKTTDLYILDIKFEKSSYKKFSENTFIKKIKPFVCY